MVFTLHRYIFREVFKVFVLATVALTLILSLGSILGPVQEYGVGPRQAIHLMLYFLPITLTFVLPMAALFAASLVYGRFANDNELDACKASGISLLTLVYPGLALAIMVAIANLLLSFHVMPAFVHRAEKSLKADAKQILFRNIQRKGYYNLPGTAYKIYADQADMQNDTLLGVLVSKTENNRIAKIITADSAKVSFNPHEIFSEVHITAHNTYQMSPEDQQAFFFELLPITAEFGSLLGDDIRFKKVDEMKRIRSDPMRFYPINKLARNAYAQFTTELLAQDISDRIKGDTTNEQTPVENKAFYQLQGNEKFIRLTAAKCDIKGEKRVELSGDVEVTEYLTAGGEPLRTFWCARAFLDIEGDELAPTLTLDLRNTRWQVPDGSEGLAHRQIIRGLLLPTTVTDRFETGNVLDNIAPHVVSSSLQIGPSPRLTALLNYLQREIQTTLAEIQAEMHSRLAFGVGCIAMIMIGIGLGIILKGGHLLTAFGVSSVPTTVLIVCIMSGYQIVRNPSSSVAWGVTLMWTGMVFLCVLAVVIHRKLLKN